MRIGIAGGTFDPIHVAHLIIAEEARVRLGLEEVRFVPAGDPWMKSGTSLSSAHHRLTMVRLAIASNPFFRASSVEIDRPGPTYTVDTLEQVRSEVEDAVEIYLIMGSDSINEFHRWKAPSRVLELCTLVSAPRAGCKELDLTALEAVSPSARQKVVVLERPHLDISGTEIRQRISHGLSVRYQVPWEVEQYIYRYGLYCDVEEGDGSR